MSILSEQPRVGDTEFTRNVNLPDTVIVNPDGADNDNQMTVAAEGIYGVLHISYFDHPLMSDTEFGEYWATEVQFLLITEHEVESLGHGTVDFPDDMTAAAFTEALINDFASGVSVTELGDAVDTQRFAQQPWIIPPEGLATDGSFVDIGREKLFAVGGKIADVAAENTGGTVSELAAYRKFMEYVQSAENGRGIGPIDQTPQGTGVRPGYHLVRQGDQLCIQAPLLDVYPDPSTFRGVMRLPVDHLLTDYGRSVIDQASQHAIGEPFDLAPVPAPEPAAESDVNAERSITMLDIDHDPVAVLSDRETLAAMTRPLSPNELGALTSVLRDAGVSSTTLHTAWNDWAHSEPDVSIHVRDDGTQVFTHGYDEDTVQLASFGPPASGPTPGPEPAQRSPQEELEIDQLAQRVAGGVAATGSPAGVDSTETPTIGTEASTGGLFPHSIQDQLSTPTAAASTTNENTHNVGQSPDTGPSL